jgi:hypothetical protein
VFSVLAAVRDRTFVLVAVSPAMLHERPVVYSRNAFIEKVRQ